MKGIFWGGAQYCPVGKHCIGCVCSYPHLGWMEHCSKSNTNVIENLSKFLLTPDCAPPHNIPSLVKMVQQCLNGLLVVILLLQQKGVYSSDQLPDCNGGSSVKLKICIIDKNITKSYESAFPDYSPGQPSVVKSSLILNSIAEFNSDTVLINVILTLFWNDSRLSLKIDDRYG